MTITLDDWQPILIAIIGALATIGVPVVSAVLSSRSSKRAAGTAVRAAATVGDKVDRVAQRLDQHATDVAAMNNKDSRERAALLEKIAQMEKQLVLERQRSRQRGPDGG